MARLGRLPNAPNPHSFDTSGIASVLSVDIFNAFQNAVLEGVKEGVDETFDAMHSVIIHSLRSKTRFTKANKQIAAHMKQDVKQAYRDRVIAEKRIQEPYRQKGTVPGWGRFSGGMLGRALNSAGMFVADATQIHMGDRGRLDKEAAHWYRLNYGVGPRATTGSKPGVYKIHFGGIRGLSSTTGGTSLGTITDHSGPSNKPLLRPRGYFGDGSKTPIGFNPTGLVAYIPTQGITARRFFDAGLASYAYNMPIIYEELLGDLIKQMVETGRGVAAQLRTISPNLKISGATYEETRQELERAFKARQAARRDQYARRAAETSLERDLRHINEWELRTGKQFPSWMFR